MIVDVHTHLPTHMSEVPPDQIYTEETMRSGETVRLTNSIDDYLSDIEIFLQISEPTTHPSDDLNDEIFLLVIPKPITRFLFLFLIIFFILA